MNTRFHFIEGYADAERRQEQLRDAAYLNLPLSLCGLPCAPLTPLRFAVLIHSRSPFVCGGFPLPENVAQFLWVMSPGFSYTDTAARDSFVESIAAGVDYESAVKEITGFIEGELLDAPPSDKSHGDSFYSWLASLVDAFGHEYGWTREHILDEPMAVLFQQLKIIAVRNGDKGPQFNRLTDEVRDKWLCELNARNAAKAETN